MTNQKDIAKKQAEIVGQLQQFPIGRTNSGGRAGGMVEVVVTNPLPGQPRVVQAKCANDCPPGEVQLLRADDGSYVALSRSAAQKTSETTTRQVSKKNPIIPKKSVQENIKLLFYVNAVISPFVGYDELTVERLWQELWIGGTWPVKKIYTVPNGYRLADAFIVNTGEKEEDYVVMGRLFPVKKIHGWSSNFDISSIAVSLGSPAAVFFTITKGQTSSQEFTETSCPLYFWRYCGGGFFYSAGSEIGVNTIDNFAGSLRTDWPRAYSWYNSWGNNNFAYANQYLYTAGNRSSFVNIALHTTGFTDGFSYYGLVSKFHIIKPSNTFTPLVSNYSKYNSLVSLPPQMLFGVDISSNWYWKTGLVKSQNINTFFSAFTTLNSNGVGDPGLLGFMGEMCVTPTRNFAVNYQAAVNGSDLYASSYSSGFLYEPLIVNNEGNKTLTVKQFSVKSYQSLQNNFLLSLSDTGESPIFTKILGIPELNNPGGLGLKLFSVTSQSNYSINPTNSILTFIYFNYLDSLWNNTPIHELQAYWYTGIGASFSLSINQSETNKEILYLKDFLLQFANFAGLTVLPSNDTRRTLPFIYFYFDSYQSCSYLKSLSSYIGNSIYIPYGFLDTDKKFYGTQSLIYSEPEKTRVLPQSSKATVKVVQLDLDEIMGEIKVVPDVKELPIYMVTPGNTGSNTIALASTNYWCEAKTKGIPMPVFVPTPGETPAPAPTPTPTPAPAPTPTPTPTPGGGYGYGL